MSRCSDCFGSVDLVGFYGDGKCSQCYGTGKDQGFLSGAAASFSGERDDCWKCEGSATCQTCGGTGTV